MTVAGFIKSNHLSELSDPLDTQEGVLSPAVRRARTQANLFGSSAVSDALSFGVGTTAAPVPLGATAGNGVSFKFSATNSSGFSRSGLFSIQENTAGGSASGVSSTATINGVATAVAHGLFGSLSLTGAGANLATSGAGVKGDLTIGTGVSSPGALLSVLQLDTNIAAAVTVPADTVFLRLTNTGSVSVQKLLEVPNVASAGLLAVHTTQTLTHSLRMRSADGTLYYVMLTNLATNRTGGV